MAGAVSILLTTTHSSSHAKQWMHQRTAAWLWVIVPLFLYLTMIFFLNYHFGSQPQYDKGKEKEEEAEVEKLIPGLIFVSFSNTVGFVALWAFGYSLIPVAKQVPLWKVFGLDEIALVQTVHIWAGYIVVSGGIIHGFVYLLYWKVYDEQTILRLISIPWKCFTRSYTCDHVYEKCNCNIHLRNSAGLSSFLCLFVLACTSLHWVRRRTYTLFYMCHATMAPLSIIMLILHFGWAFIVLAPGVLYYIVISVMTTMESTSDVSIVSVQRLGSTRTQRPCYSLTVEATDESVQAFRAGQYVKVWCRALSSVGHPFTINRVPGQPQQMRIIFRSDGPFSTQLGKVLTNTKTDIDTEQSCVPTTTLLVTRPVSLFVLTLPMILVLAGLQLVGEATSARRIY